MKIRTTAFALLALALLVVFAACDVSIIYWDPTATDPEPEPEIGLTFSLEWSDTGVGQPHMYVTYPAPSSGDTTATGTPEFFDPYSAPLDGDYGFAPSDPFNVLGTVPNEYTDERGTVYFGDLQSGRTVSGEPAVEVIDIDDTSEEILVRGFPFVSYSTEVSTYGGGITGLDFGTYTWVGVMEVYAYATTGQLEYASGTGVNAVLNVFDDGEPLAVYELPANTDLKGSSIVRINCFYDAAGFEVYQLVPDIRVIQDDVQIRSVGDAGSLGDSGIITIRKPAGE